MKFCITRFDDVYATSCIGQEVDLEELAELIQNTSAPAKAALPMLKLARFGSTRGAANSLRHDQNVLMTSGLEGDYDGELMPFQEAVDRLDATGVSYLLYTSPSNRPGKPRWRVLLPTSKELPPGARAELMDRLNGVLGGVLARESWGISQSFFFGRVDGVPFEIVWNDTEECVDDATELAAIAQPYKPAPGAAAAAGGASGKPNFKTLDESALFNLITSGQSYFHATTELAWRWFPQGVSEQDARSNIEAAFDAVPQASQDKKWRKARASVPRWIARTYARAEAAAKKPKGAGRPLVFEAPKPWPMPVNGEELIEELVQTCKNYVVMSDFAADAAALWVMHTYVFTAAMITPRLEIKSAQKRCGKTTLLTIIGGLAARPLATANISAPAVYRTVELVQPSLLVDEADTFVSENEELRGVLNAGYMRGGQVIRVVGDNLEPRIFSCWAPVAIATIRKLPDTVEDRAIAIVLQRRLKGEPITRLRLDRLTQLQPLVSKLQRWADDNFEALEAADPDVPAELNDRAADCWRVLFGISDRIGGEWPERTRKAALALSLDNDDIETIGTMLLADLRDLFAAQTDPEKQEALFSGEIVEALNALEDRPWPEYGKRRQPISKVQLSHLLKHFCIKPTDVRRGSQVNKGYRRAPLDGVFERYLS